MKMDTTWVKNNNLFGIKKIRSFSLQKSLKKVSCLGVGALIIFLASCNTDKSDSTTKVDNNSTLISTTKIHDYNSIAESTTEYYNANNYSSNSNGNLNDVVSIDDVQINGSRTNDNASRREDKGTFNPINISIGNGDYHDYLNYLDNYEVNYSYADLYDIDESLKLYNNSSLNNEQYSDIQLDVKKQLSADELNNIVLLNNKQYLESIGLGMSAFYKPIDDKGIYNICLIIAETVNYDTSTKEGLDISRIYNNLSQLKIFCTPSASIAYISDDLCLMLTPQMMNILEIMSSRDDCIEDTIIHEVKHLIQMTDFSKLTTGEKKIGICYSNPLLDVNPLWWQWFYEASAEKGMMNQTGDKNLVYPNMIGYLESLSLATILDQDNQVNDTENLCLYGDFKLFFELFDCKKNLDKKELINMMYMIQFIQYENADFKEAYTKKYGSEPSSEDITLIKREVKVAICETLARYFYTNLAKSVVDNNIPLQDIFYLITIFEADINSHVGYDEEDKLENNKNLLASYSQLQEQFFGIISSSGEYSTEEIIELFNNYALTINDGQTTTDNKSLSWLDQNKKDYIISFCNSKESFISVNMSRYYNELNNTRKLTLN